MRVPIISETSGIMRRLDKPHAGRCGQDNRDCEECGGTGDIAPGLNDISEAAADG